MEKNEVAVQGNDKGMVDVEIARAVAQIQGSMAIAKKFPRDENAAIDKIKSAAARKSLAEQAEYEYSRGGSKVSGPSIRAAEAVAQAWGNMDTGVVELRRDTDAGESLAMAYAVDLESNYWKHVTFSVPHTRDTTQGSKALTSARDIYERVMNDGSRRLRNCMLAVIPGDVMDLFMEECNRTLSKNQAPLADRINVMMQMLDRIHVTREMVERKYCCKLEALTERQVAQLRRIYLSIQDGIAGTEDHFGTASGATEKTAPTRVKVARSKDDAQKAAEAASVQKQDQEQQGEFNSFQGGPIVQPKQEQKPHVDRNQLVTEALAIAKFMGEDVPALERRVQKQFNKSAEQLTDDEMQSFVFALSNERDQRMNVK